MNSKNFIAIRGWMIKYFDLDTKEFILFALIFGFTQDGKTIFNGSRNDIGLLKKESYIDCSQIFKIDADLLESLFDKETKVYNETSILNKD